MLLNSPVVDVVAAQRNLSNRRLAIKAQLDPRFLARLRKGQRTASIDSIQRLANVLEVPLELIILPHRPVKELQK